MTALKIPDGRLEEWLGTLKPYQREQIDILLAGNDPETAAQLWVTTIGHANIHSSVARVIRSPFGIY